MKKFLFICSLMLGICIPCITNAQSYGGGGGGGSSSSMNTQQDGFVVTLRPGWNVFSTPALLSDIQFSNGGNGISFSKLENGQWISATANTGELRPLEGFLIENTNNDNITMSLTYKQNPSPTESIFQKSLYLGWNLLGITTTDNPFSHIGNNASMSLDLTDNGNTNNLNMVNGSYRVNTTSNDIFNPQLGESYGLFINALPTLYGGVNNVGNFTQNDCGGNNFSDEFYEAYNYAYNNGLISSSITESCMYGKLTRIAMAKMLSNYAINVFGLTPDTSKTCAFSDVTTALDAQYDNGVTLICQLGLMGDNITEFRPSDFVTRAEFGTLLSRILNANSDNLSAMNAADPYYIEHLNFLHNAGIIANISNPMLLEIRGYVLIMLMRADDTYSPNTTEGCTVEELLACFNADDYDACIAACNGLPGVVSQGYSPKMILQGTANELGSLKLKAVNGNVTMTSVTLSGGADFASKATNVKLMKGETAVATFVKSGNVFVAEGLDETITLGNTSTYTVKATINEATKAADLLDPFTLEASATFESPYGAELDSLGYTAISDEITTVVAYPTITKIEGVKGSNYASLKVTFNSSKELQIPASSLTGVIGGNLTGLAGKTWTVGSTENGSQYDGEVITIDGPTSIYLTVAGLNWTTTSSSDPYINLGLTNFDMNSVFTDGSIAEHANILTRFRDVVTELTDLGVNIK